MDFEVIFVVVRLVFCFVLFFSLEQGRCFLYPGFMGAVSPCH